MVYGAWAVWSLLGYAEKCCGVTSFLTRPVWASLEYTYLESHSTLLAVVHLEGA